MKFRKKILIRPTHNHFKTKKAVFILPILLSAAFSHSIYAENISLYDYEEADSSIDEAYFTGSFSTEDNRGTAQSSYNIDLGANLEKVFASSDRDTSFKADVSGNSNRGSNSGDKSVKRYRAASSITVDNYFEANSKGLFWYGKGSVVADDTFSDLQTKLSAGIGYGRVVNVTPMAKAIRLIDELIKRGAIERKPERSVYQQIANIINLESQYKSEHGSRSKFYQQYWIGDIEKVLVNQGLVNKALSANGVLAMRDVLIDEKISVRRHGWKVRAGLAYVGRNFEGVKNKPGLELGAEYHRPINIQTQFSNEATFTSILDSDIDSYTFNNDMSLIYEVDDNLDWINTWGMNVNHSAIDGDNVVTNSLTSTLAYEIGNNLDLTASAGLVKSNGNNHRMAGDIEDGTDKKFNLGVRYRLR
jgi:hypothetical protein